MKTIEERAKEKYPEMPYLSDYEEGCTDGRIEGYVEGATEQREIDIQRACEFLQNEVPIQEHYRYPKEWYIEQLKQSMKGE